MFIGLYLIFLLLDVLNCQWVEQGFDSHFSKMSPFESSKTSWRTKFDQDFSSGSLVLTKTDLIYPTWSSDDGGCIRKLSLEDGSPTGKYCFRSGDIPRSGLIPSTSSDSFVFLIKADSLHQLNLNSMTTNKWNFPDFSYYFNYVLYKNNVIFASREMCPGSYEVCYNISSVTIGNEQSNFMIENVFCSSEECYLTVDNSGNCYLRNDALKPQIFQISEDGSKKISYLGIEASRMSKSSKVSISNFGPTKGNSYTIARDNTGKTSLFQFDSKLEKKFVTELPFNTSDMEQGSCSDIIISPDGLALFFICLFPQSYYSPKNIFFKVDAVSGNVLIQKDFFNSSMSFFKCLDLLLLQNSKLLVWCTEIFGTMYYVINNQGDVLSRKVIDKGQNFVPPVSDSSNNIYYPIAFYMSDSYIMKENLG